MKTKVKFLVHPKNEEDGFADGFAYFPDDVFDNGGINRTCYSHIGQHSSCCPEYAKESMKIIPEEINEYEWAKDLKEELESLGYNLELI